MSFAKLSNLCPRMVSRENPKTIQSERTLASWYMPANSIAVLCSHMRSATVFTLPQNFLFLFVSFSSVFWKAVNFARIYAGVAAAAGLAELAFCMVFLTHKLHVLKTCLRLAKQGTLPRRPISAVYLQSSNLAGYT